MTLWLSTFSILQLNIYKYTGGFWMGLNTIPEAIEDIKAGKMIIIVDDEGRENEGDLVIAAEKVTPEIINFMAKEARGLICLPLTRERVEELRIPMMVQDNTSRFSTAFTVSIEAKHGVTTGISVHDRAATIKAAIDPGTRPSDIARPGHVFPIKARNGGVLVRAGHGPSSGPDCPASPSIHGTRIPVHGQPFLPKVGRNAGGQDQ